MKKDFIKVTEITQEGNIGVYLRRDSIIAILVYSGRTHINLGVTTVPVLETPEEIFAQGGRDVE